MAITLATAGAGSVAATGMKLGLKGTNKVLLQTLAVDMISGVSGMGAVNLLDAAGSPEYLSAIVGLGVSFFGGYKGGKAVQAIGSGANSEDIFTLTGLTASQVDDVLKYTGKNLDEFLTIVKNGELDLLLGIPDMNLNYLVKQTGKSTDEITDWLKKNNVNLNDINAGNVDDIIKGASGAGGRTGYDYLDDQLGDLNGKVIINKYDSAESVNSWWNERGYTNPPYSERTVVQDIKLTQDSTFVRVYDGVDSRLEGGWVLRAEDIKGLTPKEIQIKYALPYEPVYVGEVSLKTGDSIRLGEAAPNFGFKGGGIQIDLKQQFIGEFMELGKISDWR